MNQQIVKINKVKMINNKKSKLSNKNFCLHLNIIIN